MKPKIYFSGDHAGFRLKEKLKKWLEEQGYKIKDFGSYEYEKDDDYPDFVIPMARQVAKEKNSRGICVAGSGIGEVVATAKIRGARPVLFHSGENLKRFIETSRVHDNTNILSFGSRFVTEEEAKKAIEIWLKTKFTNETRHKRRLRKYADLGSK